MGEGNGQEPRIMALSSAQGPLDPFFDSRRFLNEMGMERRPRIAK